MFDFPTLDCAREHFANRERGRLFQIAGISPYDLHKRGMMLPVALRSWAVSRLASSSSTGRMRGRSFSIIEPAIPSIETIPRKS